MANTSRRTGQIRTRLAVAAAIAVVAVGGIGLLRAQSGGPAATRAESGHDAVRVREAFSYPLGALDGSHLKVQAVEVQYAPGGSSKPHSHPCPVIGYVLEGALRSQVEGQPAATYKAGESFYEAANGVHLVSANASTTEPVRFLAFFVCDHDAPLSGPPVSGAHVGEHHD